MKLQLAGRNGFFSSFDSNKFSPISNNVIRFFDVFDIVIYDVFLF
jgi:hypothetical protein